MIVPWQRLKENMKILQSSKLKHRRLHNITVDSNLRKNHYVAVNTVSEPAGLHLRDWPVCFVNVLKPLLTTISASVNLPAFMLISRPFQHELSEYACASHLFNAHFHRECSSVYGMLHWVLTRTGKCPNWGRKNCPTVLFKLINNSWRENKENLYRERDLDMRY